MNSGVKNITEKRVTKCTSWLENGAIFQPATAFKIPKKNSNDALSGLWWYQIFAVSLDKIQNCFLSHNFKDS